MAAGATIVPVVGRLGSEGVKYLSRITNTSEGDEDSTPAVRR